MVGLAAGILSSLRTPLYKATARVLLTPNDPTQQLNPTSGSGALGNDPSRYVNGQTNIIQSEAVAAEAAKSLDGISVTTIERSISVDQSGPSNVLRVSAIDSDPKVAGDIANAVARGYIENRRQAAVAGLEGAAKDIEDRLGPLQATIGQLDAQIASGAPSPAATTQLVSPVPPASVTDPTQPAAPARPPGSAGGPATTQEALKAARYAAAVQYETLYSRQQELLVDISLKRGDAELIAEAKTPTAPVSPRPRRDATLGVLVGLLLAVGVSVLREQLNDTVRSVEEVERLTGLPLLAQLPFDQHAADRGLAIDQRPNGPLSEAMRSLRTSIQYLAVDRPVKVILVTSSVPGEGKSMIAANLAAAFAQADYRTVLISADLRRPSINGVFGALAASPGLTGVISPAATRKAQATNGHGSVASALEVSTLAAVLRTPIEHLMLLPSGATPPNPAELLGSLRMASILGQLAENSDVVIIDSPPLLAVTDAAVLAAKCDGVVLVAAMNETPRGAVERSKAILDGTGARVLGVVANKSTNEGRGYYQYGAYYTADDTDRPSRKRLRRRSAFGGHPGTPARRRARARV